ncbi:CDP-archaeol synthase [Polymorphobacter arshaanensis]|uniref:Phosphatidate cytidylyltransferase n=1 Tax=Glacieibacterium arshaanense TaxID=2511025 RepID=A0A4Y9ERJ4_9SPHN|nr:CDP-archaeol synthase [Polymorphobacter arshaanensis]TFU06245.1 CDP-archaeol synthase [Polymorphobacter arshaanensis]
MAASEAVAATSQLGARVVVGVLLIVVALAALWAGGFGFGALVAVAVLLMFAEWSQMFRLPRALRLAGLVVLAGSVMLTIIGQPLMAIAALATGAGVLGLGARPYVQARASWVAIGLLYAGMPAIALIWLRGTQYGLALTLLTLVTVWATDIFAYFSGRAIGGPKLAPSISPNKTWAGLVGGMAGAALAVYLVYMLLDGRIDVPSVPVLWLVALAPVLAVVAQAGDFYESWLKRRVGVKDSGNLLPGHGGIMDRLDGLVPVAVVAAVGAATLGLAG